MSNIPLLLGIDDGHSDIKIYAGTNIINGAPIQFKLSSKALIGNTLTGEKKDTYPSLVHVDGSLFTVINETGEAASTKTDDYPTSKLNKALIYQSIYLAQNENILPNNREIAAVTGLPVNRYYSGKNETANKDLIANKIAFLKDLTNTYNMWDNEKNIPPLVIKEHKVFCEAQAALFDVCMNDDGKRTDFGNELLTYGAGVLDIGGRTTDCLVTVNQGKQFITDRSGTRDIGVLSLYNKIASRIKNELSHSSINDVFLKKALETGIYGFGDKAQDVSAIIKEEKQQHALQIKNFADSKIGMGNDLAGIIVVGGGAAFLKDELQEILSNVTFVENPEFSNARGFYKMGRHIYKLLKNYE